MKILYIESVYFFRAMLEKLIDLKAMFSELQPAVIYVMNRSDAYSDYRYIFDAVVACTKSFRHLFIKKA